MSSEEIVKQSNIQLKDIELIETTVYTLPGRIAEPVFLKQNKKSVTASWCAAITVFLLLISIPLFTLLRTRHISRPDNHEKNHTAITMAPPVVKSVNPNTRRKSTEALSIPVNHQTSEEWTQAMESKSTILPCEGFFRLYQEIPISSIAVAALEADENIVLFFAQQRSSSGMYSTDSSIYFSSHNSSFVKYSTIKTYGVSDVEQFTIDGEHYLAIANAHNDSHSKVNSVVYKLDQHFLKKGKPPFSIVQKIVTDKIESIQSFRSNKKQFLLIFENMKNSTPTIFEWERKHFVKTSYGWQIRRCLRRITPIEIDSSTYFICERANSKNGVTSLFKWTGSSFIEFQTFESSRNRKMYGFKANGNIFLVASSSENGNFKNTYIYRWNGTKFTFHQALFENMGEGGHIFVNNENKNTYLAIPTDIYDSWTVYLITTDGSFQLQQKIKRPADSLYSFKHINNIYIAVANYYGNSSIYKWLC